MTDKFPLRKPKTPTPSGQPPRQAPRTAMPFRPGEVVLTDGERADFELLGVKPGDPLPGDLPQRLAKARALQEASYDREISRRVNSGHVLKPPKDTPLGELPEEHLADIRHALNQAKTEIDYAELHRQELAALGQLDPSVRAAVMAAGGSDGGGIELFSSEEVPPEEEVQDFDYHHPAEQAAAPRQRAAGLEPEPEQLDPNGDEPVEETASVCPHCNRSADAPSLAEPTAGDVAAYVTSIFTDVPFVKTYEFFGGKVRLTLRTASVSQLEACFSRLTDDARTGKVLSVDDFWRHMYDYRLVLAIDKVYANGKTYQVGAAADKLLAEKGDEALPLLVTKLTSTPPMKHESVWRLFGVTWKKFNNLVESLEARAEDPSFWTAIGG